METIINELLSLYSENDTTQLKNHQRYISLCNKYLDNSWFNEHRQKIDKIKTQIERRILIQSSSRNQVIESLKLVGKKKVGFDNIGVSYTIRLIESIFCNKWSPSQFEYFKTTSYFLQNHCYDFFLSFTSRKPDPEEINILHTKYKSFIRQKLEIANWNATIERAKQKRINLLAQVVNKILINKTLKGFYYFNRIEDNSIVEQKLHDGCHSSLTFIQLVQNIMFIKPQNGKNYCFFEFEKANECIPNERRLYLLAEDDLNSFIDNNDVCEDYDDWHKEVESKDKIHLIPVPTRNNQSILENEKKISENLVSTLKKQKKSIYEGVPE